MHWIPASNQSVQPIHMCAHSQHREKKDSHWHSKRASPDLDDEQTSLHEKLEVQRPLLLKRDPDISSPPFRHRTFRRWTFGLWYFLSPRLFVTQWRDDSSPKRTFRRQRFFSCAINSNN
ncbi:Uncharacterised protein at_DN0929 [Pycnogonum litorale]